MSMPRSVSGCGTRWSLSEGFRYANLNLTDAETQTEKIANSRMDVILSMASILFWRGNGMGKDWLRLAAETYRRMTAVEYHIVLGRKGKMHLLDIEFPPENFYHLAGLHKLKRSYSLFQDASARVLKKILSGEMGMDMIRDDQNFQKVEKRLMALSELEEILDKTDTQFYEFNSRKVWIPTKITADYVAKGKGQSAAVTFSFFVKDNRKYCMNSLFLEEKLDYTERQTQYTVLLKEKRIVEESGAYVLQLYKHTTMK